MGLYRGIIIAVLLLSCQLVYSGTIRLFNDSPYPLRAVIRGADGTYLGEVVVMPTHSSVWTDTYGQSGTYGKGTTGENATRSQTPYVVLWYCMEGGDFAYCDNVTTGSTVKAEGCLGTRICKPPEKKKAPYPDQPSGQYLYRTPEEQQQLQQQQQQSGTETETPSQ